MTRVLALVLLSLFATASCDEASRIDNFDVNVSAESEIEGASILGDILSAFPSLDTSFDITQSATFQTQGYDPDDVDSVVLERLVLEVVAPEGQDLSFFGEVRFFLEAPGQPRIQVAQQTTFPVGARSVELEVTDQDLKPYVLADQVTATVEVSDSTPPAETTTVRLTATFDVDIDVI